MNNYYYLDGSVLNYYDVYLIPHRLDGPAIERKDGDHEWYQNGKLHRLDGPALDYASGYKAWWQNGKIHRLDGPAIEWSNGRRSWYINGKELNKEEFERAVLIMKLSGLLDG